jgi:hypothetical protein
MPHPNMLCKENEYVAIDGVDGCRCSRFDSIRFDSIIGLPDCVPLRFPRHAFLVWVMMVCWCFCQDRQRSRKRRHSKQISGRLIYYTSSRIPVHTPIQSVAISLKVSLLVHSHVKSDRSVFSSSRHPAATLLFDAVHTTFHAQNTLTHTHIHSN